MITMEEFEKMKEAMEKAEKDETPYMAVANEEMHVLGDPNKTETKKGEYKIRFAFPKKWEVKDEVIKETDNFKVVERTYHDVMISARLHPSVISSFVRIQSFFSMIEDDGSIREPSEDEVKMLLEELNDEMTETIYNAVGAVLKLSPEEKDCMLITSVMTTVIQIINDFPEIINEADLFFG